MSKAKSGIWNINGKKGKITVAVLSLVLLSATITMMWSVEGQVHISHNVRGYVTYEDGTPIGNALVNITIINSSNGQIRGWVLNTTDSTVNIGYYQVDIGNSQGGWDTGDTIYGYAEFNGFGGNNSTIAPAIVYAATPQWLNITIGAPRTNKTIGDPQCGGGLFVTSDTEFNFTAEDAPNASGSQLYGTFYRIWHNGWTPLPGTGVGIGNNFTLYTGNFTLDQGEGLYYIEFYSNDTAGHNEVVHNQTHYVDDTPPEYTIEFGSPTTTTLYGGNEYTMIKPCTPVWINATDGNETYPGSGAWEMTISVGVADNPYGPFQDLPQYDNFTFDQDLDGNLSIELHLQEGCFHKVVIRIWDCLDNYAGEIKEFFAVDAAPPNVTKEIGNPHYGGIYGNYTWVNFSTPIWINATDDGCNGGAGVWYVWWNITVYNETTGHYDWVGNETVYDGEEGKDLDDQVNGEVHAKFTFQEECLHELHYGAVDYVGNEIGWEQWHYVDNTPPAVNKTIPKIIKLEQSERNHTALVNITSADDYQSFEAPWSYIDAVSVYVSGNFDPTNATRIEIYNNSGFNSSGFLAASFAYNLNGSYTGWLQFHLSNRLYVEPGETLWIHLNTTQATPIYWHYHNESTYYAGGHAIVNGVENDTWDFTFRIEYYPYYPYMWMWGYHLYNETGEYGLLNESMWSGIWITSEAFFNLTWWDEGCFGGVGKNTLQYRIWEWDYDMSNWILVQDWTDYTGNFSIPWNCTHMIEIKATDLLGNTRIIQQVYYVDNLPPEIELLLPYCEYHYNATEDKEYLQAGVNITLLLHDEPECAVGIRDDEIFFRYEYTNYTRWWEPEKHPINETEIHPIYGEPVYRYGEWWWHTNETMINISFDEECNHTLYYFYDASDWLDNSNIITIYNRTFYVDAHEPYVSKTHPSHGYYHENGTMIFHPNYWINPLYPEPRNGTWTELCPDYNDQYYLVDFDDSDKVILLSENFSTFPPTGWAISEHETNWEISYSNNAGGESPEASFDWSPSFTGNSSLITPAIDTTGQSELILSFKTYVNHYSGSSYYTLKVQTSTDGSTWKDVWTLTPSGDYGPTEETILLDASDGVGSSTFYIAFNFSGNSYYINDWYIDDVKLIGNAGTLTPDDYVKLINLTTGKAEWYHVINTTITLYVYNETMDEYKYIEYDGYDYFEAIFAPNGTWWREVWPALCEGCVYCDGYQITNWTDNEDGVLDFCDYINLTNATTTSRWHVENISLDIIVEHVDYLKKCAKIELNAWDYARSNYTPILEQREESCMDPLQNLPDRLYDSQSFAVDNDTPADAISLMFTTFAGGNVNVTLYRYEGNETDIENITLDITNNPANLTRIITVIDYVPGGLNRDWHRFEFDHTITLINNTWYFISVKSPAGSVIRWHFECEPEDWYGGTTYGAIIDNQLLYDVYDWTFVIEKRISSGPCVSGIQGIYWRYEYEGVSYPTMEEWDNGTTVVDFTNFWDPDAKEFVNYYPDEPNITNYLWYVYDETEGIHFYEECRHDLYYFAKDNVCHHTPIYHQVYFVDDTLPVIEKTHPDHGYYEPLNESFEYCFLPGWLRWSYAYIPDLGHLLLPENWTQTTWGEHEGFHGEYAVFYPRNESTVPANTTRIDQWGWLISPQISLPAKAMLTFAHRADYAANDTKPNYLMITAVDKRQEDLTVDDFFQRGEILKDFYYQNGSLSSSWATELVDLSAYAGKTVYLAWVYHSLTGNVTETGVINGETWYIDNIRITPAYLRSCVRINLTADDYPPEKMVDQQQITYNDYKDVYIGASQTFIPTYPVLDAVKLALASPTCANVTVSIYESFDGNELLNTTTMFLPPQGAPDEPVWVQFHFDPPIILTPGLTYNISVIADNTYYWFYNSSSDSYPHGEGYWFMGPIGDFAFKTEYYDYNCVAGLEDIYYGYYYNDIWHPTDENDNTTLHGEVVDITKYYDWDEINANFSGHNLWYIYDDDLGIHFYEECKHDLYYWAKDNVCHHTPVYHQEYYVDNSEPEINVTYPDCGYKNATTYEKADIAFIVDTSESMAEEWTILDSVLSGIIDDLINAGRDINVTVYAITNYTEEYPHTNIASYLENITNATFNGIDIQTTDIPNDGGASGYREAWAPVTTWVAENHPWREDAMKIIVPISDEHAYNGRPSDANDWQAVYEARDECIAEKVAVFCFYSRAIESQGEWVLPDVKEQMENLSIPTLENLSIFIPGVYNLTDADAFTTALKSIVNVSMTNRTFLRAGATIWINATDMPDNECAAGISGIYWRYEDQYGKHPNYWDWYYWYMGLHWLPSYIDDIVYMFDHYWYVDTDGKVNISFDEECNHTLYWFAKDPVCHNTTIYNETYYVDGTPPETTIDNMTTNCTGEPEYITRDGYYWQACDWFNISFNVTNPGTEPCKYPDEVIVNGTPVPGIYTFVRYERKIWNESEDDFDIIKYPAEGEGEYFMGEWWYNISKTHYINITENCNHTIYYFSKDPLCNTETVHSIEVHIDDMPPKTTHEFLNFLCGDEVPHSGEEPNIIYFIGPETLIGLNATDYPIGCASGISYTEYRAWKYNVSTGGFDIPLTNGWVLYDDHDKINLTDLVEQYNQSHGTNYSVCGPYEIWYKSTDNCCHEEDMHLLDVVVDCIPPSTTKEFSGPFVKGKIEGINVTWINEGTIIWLNATDGIIAGVEEWRSGVKYIYWQIVNETLGESAFNYSENPDEDAKDYHLVIAVSDLISEYGLSEARYDFFHWSIDRVCNEEPTHHKQWIILDTSAPEQELNEIIPHKREVIPFDITGTVTEYGPYDGVGLDKIEIYYRYSEDNSSWGDPQIIYTKTYTTRVTSDTFTFSFDAPEGPGYYRFFSKAYDKLGNEETVNFNIPETWCYVEPDIYPPDITKDYEAPYVDLGTGPYGGIHGITSGTHILITVTDLPDEDYSGIYNISVRFLSSTDWNSGWIELWVWDGIGDPVKTVEGWIAPDGTTSNNFNGFDPLGDEMYTIHVKAVDNLGHSYMLKQQFRLDNEAPTSYVNPLSCPYTPYDPEDWESWTPLTITATASDSGVGIKEIHLWYRYYNNLTKSWSNWYDYGANESGSYTWTFLIELEPGYYRPGDFEFYTIAVDKLGNEETKDQTAEATCYIEPIPADLNADGRVNVGDMVLIGQHWGETPAPDWLDLNGDDIINVGDLVIIGQHWTG